MFSLSSQIIHKLIHETLPSFQLTCPNTDNLGFGFIFYGLTRTVRPKNIVVIGSKGGFAPITYALGIKDNEGNKISKIECSTIDLESKDHGKVFFIDPSYSIGGFKL
jgi:hypothetical protein